MAFLGVVMIDFFCLFIKPDNSDHALFHALNATWARRAKDFHTTLSGYAPTRLWNLRERAAALGLGSLSLKDESSRFGLKAFKVLGASYAMARILAGRAGLDMDRLRFDSLAGIAAKTGQLTFVTATDGNHGRGVAWAARQFGHKAVVCMPAGTARTRVENVRREGAEVMVGDGDYDACVQLARRLSYENGWLLLQDTSWSGYSEVPLDICRGYTTICKELFEQYPAAGPTHVFLQAGVGSFAAAMVAVLSERWPDIVFVVVEPTGAACLYRTAQCNDGRVHAAAGPLETMMAGLCCGEPSPQAWEILRRRVSCYVCCADRYASLGMGLLARPLCHIPNEYATRSNRPVCDPVVVSGESGAVTMGVLAGLALDKDKREFRERLGLGPEARVLLISTEGDTNPDNYRRVLAAWDRSVMRGQLRTRS